MANCDFGATMFGAKAAESSSLNGFHYTAFENVFGPSATVKNPLHKRVDATRLPLCEAELQQRIHRSAFVAIMWPGVDQQTTTSST